MKSINKRKFLFIVVAIIIFYGYLYLRYSINENNDVTKTYDIHIPKLTASSNQLNINFEALQVRLGYYLAGPTDSNRSNAKSIFDLNNVSEVDFYEDLTSENNLIGVKNGKIVFWGTYGLTSSMVVKDLLVDSALTIKPAIYKLPQKYPSWKSYIWKLDNGYMAAVVISQDNKMFYEQTVFSIAYVTDLTYLSYVN